MAPGTGADCSAHRLRPTDMASGNATKPRVTPIGHVAPTPDILKLDARIDFH